MINLMIKLKAQDNLNIGCHTQQLNMPHHTDFHIWLPALKLKGRSEVNTSLNKNEETNNQSHASSVSMQV